MRESDCLEGRKRGGDDIEGSRIEAEKRFWFKTEGLVVLQSTSLNPNKLLMMPLPGAEHRRASQARLNPKQKLQIYAYIINFISFLTIFRTIKISLNIYSNLKNIQMIFNLYIYHFFL